MNINQTQRRGGKFVKKIVGGGSPHAEVAASKAFEELGVPHIPISHEQKDGDDYVTAPYHDNLHTLALLGASHPMGGVRNVLPQLKHVLHDKRRIGQIALAEWLINADDRHGGNYALDKDKGLLSIDHGWAWHPSTLYWPHLNGKNSEDMDETRYILDAQSRNISEHLVKDPLDSELFHHLTTSGMPRAEQHAIEVHPDDIKQALHAEPRIVSLAHEATSGLPEHSRQQAVDAARARYLVLKRHLQESGKLTLRDLSALTEEAKDGLRQ